MAFVAGVSTALVPLRIAVANPPGQERSRFHLVAQTDIPTVILGVTSVVVPLTIAAELDPPHCGTSVTSPCDLEQLNILDRTSVTPCLDGDCSAFGDSAFLETISDVQLAVTPVVAAVLYGFDYADFGGDAWQEDMVMMIEAFTISSGLGQIAAITVSRPRPFLYGPSLRHDRVGAGANQSFFSGHVAATVAVATSFAYVTTRRRPEMADPWLVWGGAALFSLPMTAVRVGSGNHFWTDSLMGLAVGIGAGLIVPYLHEVRTDSEQLQLSIAAGPASLGVQGTF